MSDNCVVIWNILYLSLDVYDALAGPDLVIKHISYLSYPDIGTFMAKNYLTHTIGKTRNWLKTISESNDSIH